MLPPECGSEAQEPIRIGLQVLGMSERGEHGVRQREGLSVTTKMEGKGEKKNGERGNKEKKIKKLNRFLIVGDKMEAEN